MKVEIDDKSGFCFGVRNAVEIAEKALNENKKVYSLGPIVHNDMEVRRLADIGLISINYDEFSKLKNSKVLIRAHGEPPETYRIAKQNNIEIIEATCPIVKKLQSQIKQARKKPSENGSQVVIFGKPKHAEVIGLLGQINNEGILVTNPFDLSELDFTKPITLFSQTTMSVSGYLSVIEAIHAKYKENGIDNPETMLTVNNTICRHVSDREPHLKHFAKTHDVVIFVSGNESSNGKMLYQVCKSVNSDTYFVVREDDLNIKWFENKHTVGICGATSTPKWLIEKIKEAVLKLFLPQSA